MPFRLPIRPYWFPSAWLAYNVFSVKGVGPTFVYQEKNMKKKKLCLSIRQLTVKCHYHSYGAVFAPQQEPASRSLLLQQGDHPVPHQSVVSSFCSLS